MNILELAGFHSNYGSNFIPTLINLESHLKRKGHKTFFIFSNQNMSKEFLEWEVPFAEKYDTLLMNFSSIRFVFDVVKFIKRNDIKVVHAHFCPSIFVTLIKKLSPRNVLFLEHIHSCPYNNKKTFKAFLKRLRNFFVLDKKILKVCISESMMPMVQYSFPRQKLVCCPNAIELSRFKMSKHNKNENFDILLFGYNYYVKGVDIAIKAVSKLNSSFDNIKLNIVMGDHYEKNLRKISDDFGQIPSFVTILKPTHNIDDLYKKNLIFLNASRSEGGSYAILEAYYAGALCVISDVPASLEANLKGAFYFKSENIDSLALALSNAYQVKDIYSNDTDYIIDKFSIDVWSNSILNLMGLNND